MFFSISIELFGNAFPGRSIVCIGGQVQVLLLETCFASSFLLNGWRFKTIRNQIILILKLTPQILRGETWFAASLLLNGMRSVVLVGFILNCWIEHVSCGLRLQLTGSYWESFDLALSATRHNKLPVRRSLGGSRESF